MAKPDPSGSAGLIPLERIERCIYVIRGVKVMVSEDLAELYGVPARRLNQAVKRNVERFPSDFMFQLTLNEARTLRSQFVTLEPLEHYRYRPYAFTEEGVAMLSAVLRSAIAINVSIQIMRAFVRLRQALASHEVFGRKLDAMEKKLEDHDEKFSAVFAAIRAMMEAEAEQAKRPRIGFESEAGGGRRAHRSKPHVRSKRARTVER